MISSFVCDANKCYLIGQILNQSDWINIEAIRLEHYWRNRMGQILDQSDKNNIEEAMDPILKQTNCANIMPM